MPHPTNRPTQPLPWVDVEATCRAVANARVYFERIDLHPLAVALSFVQTVADKRVGFGAWGLGLGVWVWRDVTHVYICVCVFGGLFVRRQRVRRAGPPTTPTAKHAIVRITIKSTLF